MRLAYLLYIFRNTICDRLCWREKLILSGMFPLKIHFLKIYTHTLVGIEFISFEDCHYICVFKTVQVKKYFW